MNITDIKEIPLTDREAWDLYPKSRWLYSTGQLLDYQKVDWVPFEKEGYDLMLKPYYIDRVPTRSHRNDGSGSVIYAKGVEGAGLVTTAVICKGELKWTAQHGLDTGERFEELNGSVDLKIQALSIIHLQKFSGVITVYSVGATLIAIKLRAELEYSTQYGDDWLKKVGKLYTKKQWSKD